MIKNLNQFTKQQWLNVLAVFLIGVIITSVYFKWETVISIGAACSMAYFIYLNYKKFPFKK